MEKLLQRSVVFFNSPKYVFLFSLGIGILFSLIALIFPQEIYADVANVYAYYAREIGWGNFAEGWVGRVPMLNILLAGGLAFCGMEAFQACILVSSAFFLLTLPLLRRYLEYFLTPLQAAWGCFLFVTAPKMIRYSISGMLESCRYFFLTVTLLYFFRLAEKLRLRDAVIFGLALGALSVSRGEAIFLVPLLLGLFPFYVWFLSGEKFWKNTGRKITMLAAAVVIAIIVMLPFCFINLKYNGCFATDVRLVEFVPGMAKSTVPAVSAAPVKSVPFMKNSVHALSEFFRGGYEPYVALAFLGMILLLKRKQWNWQYSLLTVICFLHIVIYFKINSSYRYHLYVIPLFMPFIITGAAYCIAFYRQWKFRKMWMDMFLGILLFSIVIFQGINGLERFLHRENWKENAVAFLKEYNQKKFPGKRMRLADAGCVDLVYHSGAFRVCNYKRLNMDLQTIDDFDLLIVSRRKLKTLKRTDLIPVAHPLGEEFYLFRLKTASEKGEHKVVEQ